MAGIEQAPQQTLDEKEKSAQDTAVGIHERRDLEQGKADKYAAEGKEIRDEAFLVTFSPGDPEDPRNWSKKMKWGVTSALSATGFNRIMVSTVRLSHWSNATDPIFHPSRP